MSLTSVLPITAGEIRQVCIPDRIAKVMTDIPVWDTLDIYFSAMSDLAAPVSSRAWTCSPAISSYIQNGDSTAISGPLKPYVVWLDTGKHLVMAYLFAACTDWLVGSSRHPVSSLLSQWSGFRFTVLCASVCVVRSNACVLLFAPRCWLISVPVVVRDSCLSLQACSYPMCLCTVSRIDRNPSAVSWFVCAAPTSMGSSSITWCYFFRSSSFSKATSVAVPRVLACTVLNRWPAKALKVNPSRKLTDLPSSPIAHTVG